MAKRDSKILPKSRKCCQKAYGEVVKNMSNIVVNNDLYPCKLRFCKGFYYSEKF